MFVYRLRVFALLVVLACPVIVSGCSSPVPPPLPLACPFGFFNSLYRAGCYPPVLVYRDTQPPRQAYPDALNAGCDFSDLPGGATDRTHVQRVDPEWAPVLLDPSKDHVHQPPVILEGTIATPYLLRYRGDPTMDKPLDYQDQLTVSAVAQEDLPWDHYTHDQKFEVLPDPLYQHLLASHTAPATTTPTTEPSPSLQDHVAIGVEWENAHTDLSGGAPDFKWGSEPDWVWPSAGDRVWVEGQYIFDCGHPSFPPSGAIQDVNLVTEIHPPRALVTFRLNKTTSAGSWLPVTGINTAVPVTEADVFVSGRGGGAVDACSLTGRSLTYLFVPALDSCDSPSRGHTGPIIPIDDRNYVFDIYPPGTDYTKRLSNGTFLIHPPVPPGSDGFAALQYRTFDRMTEVPPLSCGSSLADCRGAKPIFCLIDATTPPPTQSETTCPQPVQHPSRLRVILPFRGTNPAVDPNIYAASILLGWDVVPIGQCPASVVTPSVDTGPFSIPTATSCAPIRTFMISLHQLKILAVADDTDIDWDTKSDMRLFVGVAGQWKYLPGLPADPETRTCNHPSDNLTTTTDGDCYAFDSQPWAVSVQDGMPIHISAGGYEYEDVDGGDWFELGSNNVDADFCRSMDGSSCDPGTGSAADLASFNDQMLPEYEIDLTKLQSIPNRAFPNYGVTPAMSATFTTDAIPGDEPLGWSVTGVVAGAIATEGKFQYSMQFSVQELPQPTWPSVSASIGSPSYTSGGHTWVTSATPITLQANCSSVSPLSPPLKNDCGLQYRAFRQGTPLPVYPDPAVPFPVYWQQAGFAPGPMSAPVSIYLNAHDGAEGIYALQYSAQAAIPGALESELTQPELTQSLLLDTTPPNVYQTSSVAGTITPSTVLGCSALDPFIGSSPGSGVQSVSYQYYLVGGTPPGWTTVSGSSVNFSISGPPGNYIVSCKATDNVGNQATPLQAPYTLS